MIISPLAIPLMLNPVGVVILMVASVGVQDLGLGAALIAVIVVIMVIDLAVLKLVIKNCRIFIARYSGSA